MNLMSDVNLLDTISKDENFHLMQESVKQNVEAGLGILQKSIIDSGADPKRFLSYRISFIGDELMTLEWFFAKATIGFIFESDSSSAWYVKTSLNEQKGLMRTLSSEALGVLLQASGVL
jgi:DNA polymerase III gamma/tau subunit